MSIKLYECFRIKSRLWPDFTNAMTEKATELFARHLINRVQYIDTRKMWTHFSFITADERKAGWEDPRTNLAWRIAFIMDILEQTGMELTGWKLENYGTRYWPIYVQVYAYPFGNWIAFGEFRGSLNGLAEWFRTYPGVEDFSYWNNTDPDENVTPQQWAYRGRVWDKLLDRVPQKIDIVNFLTDASRMIVSVDHLLGIGYGNPNGELERLYQEIYGSPVEDGEFMKKEED